MNYVWVLAVKSKSRKHRIISSEYLPLLRVPVTVKQSHLFWRSSYGEKQTFSINVETLKKKKNLLPNSQQHRSHFALKFIIKGHKFYSRKVEDILSAITLYLQHLWRSEFGLEPRLWCINSFMSCRVVNYNDI